MTRKRAAELLAILAAERKTGVLSERYVDTVETFLRELAEDLESVTERPR